MGQEKEALRAAVGDGPRAALTRWGGAGMPEPSENTSRARGSVLSLLREEMRSGASWRWLVVWKKHPIKTNGKWCQKALDSLLTLQPIGGPQRLYTRRCSAAATVPLDILVSDHYITGLWRKYEKARVVIR